MPVSRFLWWLRATRPPAAINLLPPLLFGQVLALQQGIPFNSIILFWLLAYGIANQLYIVFCNDWADRDADRLNRNFTLISGGSRALVEGPLTNHAVLKAGLGAALAMLGLSLGLDRPRLLFFAIAALALLWAYSLPPFRLNYRGGGEVLQALGVGLLLPLIGFYAQATTLIPFPWERLPPLVGLHLASALASAIPDHKADQQSGKRTIASLWGPRPAAGLALGSSLVSLTLSAWLTPLKGLTTWAHFVPAALLVAATPLVPRLNRHQPSQLYFGLALIAAAALYTTAIIANFYIFTEPSTSKDSAALQSPLLISPSHQQHQLLFERPFIQLI